jgi:hypothetical protein
MPFVLPSIDFHPQICTSKPTREKKVKPETSPTVKQLHPTAKISPSTFA